MPDPWIRIGAVRSVNPARRELRVAAVPTQAHQFDAMEWVGLAAEDGVVLRCRVSSVKRRNNDVTIALGPGVTRDTVAAMKRFAVFMEEGARKPQPEGDWSLTDLIGLAVTGPGDTMLGTVREVIEAPANAVMEITKPDGGSVLLPVIEQVIESIDLKNGRMTVGDITPYAVDDED